jgi:hypothetical protein
MARYILQPRWIPWHVLCVAVSVLFLRLSGWQWDVAHQQAQLDWQNAGYSAQWIVFIGFVWWFWFKFMKDQRLVEAQRADQEEELID